MNKLILLALLALLLDYAITGLLYNPPYADEENVATKRMLDYGDRLTYVFFVLILLAMTGFALFWVDSVWPFAASVTSLFLLIVHLYGVSSWVFYYFGL